MKRPELKMHHGKRKKENEFILSININLTLLLLAAAGHLYLAARSAVNGEWCEVAVAMPSDQILLRFKLDVVSEHTSRHCIVCTEFNENVFTRGRRLNHRLIKPSTCLHPNARNDSECNVDCKPPTTCQSFDAIE